MALNKDSLGQELKTATDQFNNVVIDVTDAAAMDAYRLNYWTTVADAIITHFKTAGVLKVPGLGLNAGAVAVTGTSITGKLE